MVPAYAMQTRRALLRFMALGPWPSEAPTFRFGEAVPYRLAPTLGRPGAELRPQRGSLTVTMPGRSLVAAERE